MYLRFITACVHEVSRRPRGIFQSAYELADSPEVEPWYREALSDDLAWFESRLPIPPRERFARGRAICWFRGGGHESIARLWAVVAVLRENGVVVLKVRTWKPGLILYEDKEQVVALPWRDLRLTGRRCL